MHGKAGWAMAKQKLRKKGIVRVFRAAFILIVLAVIGLVGWNYLAPMITADGVTLHESYTVEKGDIQTFMSFSATLGVKRSETHTAGEMTRVKALYVTSGDEVSQEDPLVLLSNGELFTAGFDGVVNEIRFSVGDWVRPNFYIVQVCDLVNLEVTMDVDEYDVKSLSVGQSCIVRVISLGMDFETTIAHINRVSSSSGTLAYYTVSCDLTVPEEVLPGMRATVIIPDQSASDVNILSMKALAFDDEEQAYVLLKDADGGYEDYTVETGLSDGINVEIVGGLDAGDVVYAVSGTESVKAAFSLEELYTSLVGEKVVINAASGMMPGGMGGTWNMSTDGTGAAMPDMGTIPDMGTTPGAAATTDTENTDRTQDVQDVQDLLDMQNAQGAQSDQTTDTNTEP